MTSLQTPLVVILLASLTLACDDVRPTPIAHGSDGAVGVTEPTPGSSTQSEPTVAAEERVGRIAPQDTAFLVFGLVRPDNVVMPQLLRTEGRWAEVVYFDIGPPIPEPGAWAQATFYNVVDTLGVESTLQAGRPVRVCCGGEGNDVWAHSTDRSGEDVESFAFPMIGYGFSSPIMHAAFIRSSWALPFPSNRWSTAETYDRSLPTARRPTVDHVRDVLDSLAPIPDSLLPLPDTLAPLISMDIWEANLEGEAHAFIQVRQIRRWEGCFMVAGWLTHADPPQVEVLSSGLDDCDGKGHGSRRPWALFQQGDITYSIVEARTYSGSSMQIWRRNSERAWERIPLEAVRN